MLTQRQLFLKNMAQTSDAPANLEIERAEGIFLFDNTGKSYVDLISGVSVSNVGHKNAKVIEALKNQVDKYMHLMVYGEYVLSPQVAYAKLLTDNLPENLNSVYYVNSGSEAIEGALKLAKRYTEKHKIIACKNAYHGSTHGALSLMSDETFSQAFRPLIPGISFIEFNNENEINYIDNNTACVIVEAIQGEAGIIPAEKSFLKKIREKCNDTGALLIIDEIQTGFGRTGTLFAFEQYDIVPDILVIAKAMGGGMPIGAFVSDKNITDVFMNNPVLGHITTFGGHPVSAAAAKAALEVILNENLVEDVFRKGKIFTDNLIHSEIKSVRGLGLYYSVELESFEKIKKFISFGYEIGFTTDWFLFEDKRFRIAPPLNITDDEIIYTCDLIKKALDRLI
jgi:acetylornithine/succinyldiaminopimelate/putrescine aminotransferase